MRRRRDVGQSLVEFALVAPILVLMLVAIFDLGRLVFAYNDITNAARTGVRVAIVDQTVNKARDATISQATSLSLTAADVDVAYKTADLASTCPTPKTLTCVAEIVVRYQWRSITPLIGNLVGPVTVRSETRMPIERIYP